jgi:hypothetical protein
MVRGTPAGPGRHPAGVLRLAGAVRLLHARAGACRTGHDGGHAVGFVELVAVMDVDRGGRLGVGAGGVVLLARLGPRHVVEDVAADLPVAGPVGVEGAQDVVGVLEVVVRWPRPGSWAVKLSIPIRVGVIGSDEQRLADAKRDLEALGVTSISADHVRHFGRGRQGQPPDPANLCGRCGTGKAAIGPNGEVSPCVFSGWMGVGNVQDTPLAAILSGAAMAEANATIRRTTRMGKCKPDDDTPCVPEQLTSDPCAPEDYEECTPGYPPSECSPRGG